MEQPSMCACVGLHSAGVPLRSLDVQCWPQPSPTRRQTHQTFCLTTAPAILHWSVSCRSATRLLAAKKCSQQAVLSTRSN